MVLRDVYASLSWCLEVAYTLLKSLVYHNIFFNLFVFTSSAIVSTVIKYAECKTFNKILYSIIPVRYSVEWE